jgi:hypothetical protein
MILGRSVEGRPIVAYDAGDPDRRRRLGGVFYSGPRPLSEPESRIAYRLIRRLRPQVSIWFHRRVELPAGPLGPARAERMARAALVVAPGG